MKSWVPSRSFSAIELLNIRHHSSLQLADSWDQYAQAFQDVSGNARVGQLTAGREVLETMQGMAPAPGSLFLM